MHKEAVACYCDTRGPITFSGLKMNIVCVPQTVSTDLIQLYVGKDSGMPQVVLLD